MNGYAGLGIPKPHPSAWATVEVGAALDARVALSAGAVAHMPCRVPLYARGPSWSPSTS